VQINAGSALRALLAPADTLGEWYSYGWNQAAGQALVPAEGMFAFTALSAGMFARAACVSSAGYVGFSAGEGLVFATVDVGTNMPPEANIDLSKFTGITYWAMSKMKSAVRVQFPDEQTDGLDPNAACQSPAASGPCDDYFSATDQRLTSTWTQYTVAFGELFQRGFGAAFENFDVQNVHRLQFEDEGSGSPDGGAPAFQFCIGPVYLTD
jgi:hypothetical protein